MGFFKDLFETDADRLSALRKTMERAEKQIEKLRKELSEVSTNYKGAEASLKSIQEKYVERGAELTTAKNELASVSESLKLATLEIAKMRQLVEQRDEEIRLLGVIMGDAQDVASNDVEKLVQEIEGDKPRKARAKNVQK